MKIAVLVSFVVILGVFLFATQVPVTLTEDEVAKAVEEVSSGAEFPVDEDLLEAAVHAVHRKTGKGAKYTSQVISPPPIWLSGWSLFCISSTWIGSSKNSTNALHN